MSRDDYHEDLPGYDEVYEPAEPEERYCRDCGTDLDPDDTEWLRERCWDCDLARPCETCGEEVGHDSDPAMCEECAAAAERDASVVHPERRAAERAS